MIVTRWGARFHGRQIPCSIGRGGIRAEKREGDGASPAGIWRLTGGLYRPERQARPKARIALGPARPRHVWSDDPEHAGYNHLLMTRGARFSHERLRRADPLYDIVLFSDWNWPEPRAGAGSAIFVHHWRRPRFPTAGCIGFAAPDLRWILSRWQPHGRIFLRPTWEI